MKNWSLYVVLYLLAALILNFSPLPQKRFLIKGSKFNLSSYGMIVGIATYVGFNQIKLCNLDWKKILLVCVLYLISLNIFCIECQSSYQYITVYQYLIPLILLFFDCNDTSKILKAILIATAIGRLGCIMAGCCYGPPIKNNDSLFSINYTDPDQIVNQQLGTLNIRCYPTIILECIVQFSMIWLASKYSNQTSTIFSIGSMLLVYMSSCIEIEVVQKNPIYHYFC